ncbi:hypothetical protein ACGFNV_46535 [Streptomyces sp. NPDC048751]
MNWSAGRLLSSLRKGGDADGGRSRPALSVIMGTPFTGEGAQR